MTQTVYSSDNHHVKLAASLRRKKIRDETGLFLIEGFHLVQEAASVDWQIEYLLLTVETYLAPQFYDLRIIIEQLGHQIITVSDALFNKVAETESPQGIIAVVRQPEYILKDYSFTTGRTPLWLILDAVQDPGNVGTLVRTADAAGISGVILSSGCADIFSGKAIRASMGSIFHIPITKASVAECLDFCRWQKLHLFVADGAAENVYASEDLTGQCAIVFGNEGAGVGRDFKEAACGFLRIPILGRADSLNVASAAAVILYEAVRQRGFSL